MPDLPRLRAILEQLRASGFADLKGARVTASIPVGEALLNQLVAASIPARGPVRDVSLHPKAGNRIGLRVKLARPDFLPPLSFTAEIERQPELPDRPLVLRMLSLPGLMSLAGAALSFAAVLPPGIKLEQDRVLVDMRALLEHHGHHEIVQFLESVRITTEEGRLIADVAVRV